MENYRAKEIMYLVGEKIKKSFLITALAVLFTFLVTYYVSSDFERIYFVYEAYPVLMMLQLGIAFVIGFAAYRFNGIILTLLLFSYAGLTGLTLSFVSLLYTFESVLSVLVTTTILFSVLSAYGLLTKNNLYSYRSFLTVGLITLIVASLVNYFFITSEILDLGLSALAVVIFIIYTAYDVQTIKTEITMLTLEGQENLIDNAVAIGAFKLYLDFINLFIHLLSLFGKKRD